MVLVFLRSRVVHRRLAIAAATVFLADAAWAANFGPSVSYVAGTVPSGLQTYENPAAVGPAPSGTTGEQFGFPGVVSPFNPPFDTDQIVIVGQGGQLTVQLPAAIRPGSGAQVGVFSNAGLDDNDYPNGTAASPAMFFGGGTALVSASEDGVKWSDLGLVNFSNPENFYLNAGPYDTAPPANPQLADFGQPFTGTLDSFDGETYGQILGTLNGSAGGSWLNLSGAGLSEVNYLRFSVPASLPSGSYIALEAVSVADTLTAPASWSAGSGSWAASSQWTAGIIPSHAQDVAVFPSAAAATTITLDGNFTAGNLIFSAGPSYAITPGSGGRLTLDNGLVPATISVSGAHAISAALVSAGPVKVFGNGTLTLGSSAVLGGALTIGAGTTVDLLNQTLTINYGSPDNEAGAVQSAVAALSSAYSGGAGQWSGPGLTSSLAAGKPGRFALGYADGNADPNAAVAANQLVIKYTVAGDADLNGMVGFSDLVAVAQNFGLRGEDWAHGNFTYDAAGSVGFADLVLVAQNFGQSVGTAEVTAVSPGSRDGITAVPEPGAAAMVVPWPLALARRRRRR